MVFELGFGQWLLACLSLSGGQVQHCLCYSLGTISVQGHGLFNAPATFERLMDQVLQGLRWPRCLVYLDDIISFETTFEDALDNLKLIFERLRTFVVYYRRFIPSFADLAEPLLALTGTDVPFVWRPACTTAFLQLRDVLVRAPILAFPTESGDYILDTYASNFGLGGVLSQIQNDANVSSPISVAPSVHSRGSTAPRKERCWQLSPVCSFVHTYAALDSPSGRITSLLFGSIGLKIQKVWWLGGCIPLNSSSSQLSTGPAGITVTLTGYLGSLLPPVASALAWIAPRWTQQWKPFHAESVGDSEDADLVPIQSGEYWVAQLDDDLSRPATQTGEVFRITALQLEDATCITLLEWIRSDVFSPGQKWRACARKYGFCGITVITLFTGVTITAAGTTTGQRITISGLSRFVVWRSFGPESYISPLESSVLLVWNGWPRERLAEAVHNLHEEEITHRSSSPVGQHSHRSSLGPDCFGHSRRLRPHPGRISIHPRHRWLLQ